MNGEYRIQFETTNKYLYKMVERACQAAVDEEGRRETNRRSIHNVNNYNWENEMLNG